MAPTSRVVPALGLLVSIAALTTVTALEIGHAQNGYMGIHQRTALQKREGLGELTFYNAQTGSATACGNKRKNTEMFAAVNANVFGPGSNGSPTCKKCARVEAKGKSIVVPIDDKCGGCKDADIDLSFAAWDALGEPRATGRYKGTWKFVDCGSGGGGTGGGSGGGAANNTPGGEKKTEPPKKEPQPLPKIPQQEATQQPGNTQQNPSPNKDQARKDQSRPKRETRPPPQTEKPTGPPPATGGGGGYGGADQAGRQPRTEQGQPGQETGGKTTKCRPRQT